MRKGTSKIIVRNPIEFLLCQLTLGTYIQMILDLNRIGISFMYLFC